MEKRAQGRRGEQFAAEYLKTNGFLVLAFNYTRREGEIDIIARDDSYIVFAEVKTRKERSLVGGLESVDARKQAKIKTAAGYYLSENPTELQPRFDVIEIEQDGQKLRVKSHIENAF